MYQIHRDDRDRWSITFDKYTLGHITGDLMKVIQVLNSMEVRPGTSPESDRLREQKQVLKEVYGQLNGGLMDIREAERRSIPNPATQDSQSPE